VAVTFRLASRFLEEPVEGAGMDRLLNTAGIRAEFAE
jgi:hypothetical protein